MILILVVKILREKPSGSFIIRDSNSFQGAYGLAVKVGPFVHDSKPSQGWLESLKVTLTD